MDVNDARRERAELREHIRAVADVAAREERRLSDEERSAVERSRARVAVLSKTIEYQDYIRELDEQTALISEPSSNGAQALVLARPTPVQTVVRAATSSSDRPFFPNDERYARAFSNYIRRGVTGMSAEDREAFQPYFSSGGTDTRAMATTPDSAGGALIPEDFYRRLIEAMKAIGGVRLS